jgi:hypothetical protein
MITAPQWSCYRLNKAYLNTLPCKRGILNILISKNYYPANYTLLQGVLITLNSKSFKIGSKF